MAHSNRRVFRQSLARLVAASICLGVVSNALAQDAIKSEPYVWKNVTVGAGGFIPGIVFSRVEKGLAYLRSDMGATYRWDERQQLWIPLQDPMGESSYHGAESVAPDPVDANTVYVAAGMYKREPSAILRSRDRGNTWDIFPVTFKMGGNEEGRGLGERLAVDPNDTSILYFGSRENGLQHSTNHGETWEQVASFPLKGMGPSQQLMHAGLSFVVFDPKSGEKGSATKTIFVGNADPGDAHLFRSDDAGKTWKSVPGQPAKEMLPAKAEIDDTGVLFITYGNNVGPNGVTKGAVWKLDTKSNQWTDISPDKRPDRPNGGYMGISLDRQKPGTLAVTTMNRWGPVDTVWRSTDGGATWMDIVAKSERDVSVSPFLLWGDPKAKLGWWMAALAIDPFDSDHAVYATGATVYATKDFSNVNKDQATHWFPWIKGIEQTAILTLMSPADGPHLFSGFGDIEGFVHDDLDKSPPQGMYTNPRFGNTETLDYAGKAPNVIVRSGPAAENVANAGYSEDGGKSWNPLTPPKAASTGRRQSIPAISVSADGKTIMVMSSPAAFTRDRGKTWETVKGLPSDGRPVADRVEGQKFYCIDFATGKFFISTDGGANFNPSPSQGLPSEIRSDRPGWSGDPWPLQATLGVEGDLWFVSKSAGLFHSSDGGKSFSKAGGDVNVEAIAFGKAPEGKDYPALFCFGKKGDLRAVWRSDDAAQSWIRVNDDQHQWGTRFRCIAADPRVFGRVYIGTDGRGILYGTPTK